MTVEWAWPLVMKVNWAWPLVVKVNGHVDIAKLLNFYSN